MKLVHKSVDVRQEVWQRLRVNAAESGVSLRDYLTFLIERSEPVDGDDLDTRASLDQAIDANDQARRIQGVTE
jgi:macrodomain Ter protein organizer (MatP/YcbG family)